VAVGSGIDGVECGFPAESPYQRKTKVMLAGILAELAQAHPRVTKYGNTTGSVCCASAHRRRAARNVCAADRMWRPSSEPARGLFIFQTRTASLVSGTMNAFGFCQGHQGPVATPPRTHFPRRKVNHMSGRGHRFVPKHDRRRMVATIFAIP